MVQEAAARTTRASRCVNGASFACCLTTADRERFHRPFSVRRRYVFLSLARKLPLSRSSHAALLLHRGPLFQRMSERRRTFSRLVVSRRSRWRRGCSSWRHDDARAWEALLIGADLFHGVFKVWSIVVAHQRLQKGIRYLFSRSKSSQLSIIRPFAGRMGITNDRGKTREQREDCL